MIKIIFQNVGQGDSIIIEWEIKEEKFIGIIDCNIYNDKNPVLEYLQQNQIFQIEFILLSHLHYDHFSGMADVFEHCIKNKIRTKYFFHTNASFLGEIYNRIFTSQKLQKGVLSFVKKFESYDKFIDEIIQVNCHLKEFNLTDNIKMKFLAPKGRIYEIMSKQLARKINKITTSNLDINKIATITCIQNDKESILLTSDAALASFHKISDRIDRELVTVQVPHHGSFKNIYPKFWYSIRKQKQCPSVLSVGNEPKDKLPDIKSVEFFHINDFDVQSTNCVYGINDFFKVKTTQISPKSICLDNFSRLRKSDNNDINDKFNGDKIFNFNW